MDSLAYIAPWVLASVGIGVIVGLALTRARGRSSELDHAEQERQATLKALVELLKAIEQINGDVECHNTEIRQTADHVGSLRTHGEMENVQQALLSHMVGLLKANKRLQNDLVCTRFRMEEQAQEIDHVRREARTDGLTGVANRKAYDEKLQVLMAEWESRGSPFVLMLVDLDHLKRINDSHGHPAGDHVLEKIGQWIKEWLRAGDFAGRYGGDEFAVLLPNTDWRTGLEAAERLRAQTAERASKVTFRGEQVSVSLSIGVAAPRAGDRPETLVERADQALYRSKDLGRNRVTCQAPADAVDECQRPPAATYPVDFAVEPAATP